MTPFQAEAQRIRDEWISERITKVTAIVQFDTLMHEFGLLPEDEEVNQETSEQDLLVLLNQAVVLREESVDTIRAQQAGRKFEEQREVVTEVGRRNPCGETDYTPEFQCPICKKYAKGLYGEVSLSEGKDAALMERPETIKVNPRRCENCVREYLDEVVFKTKRRYILDTKMAPMSETEQQFFHQYEMEMEKFPKEDHG